MKYDTFLPADILIPAGQNLDKWSVIACDQFSSEPEYWNRVAEYVANAPSTLNMIIPEAFLESGSSEEDITKITNNMAKCLDSGYFVEYKNSFIYVERTLQSGVTRRGLVGMLDLEQYDFDPAIPSAVRASEGTILSRLPARINVRAHACLELPHIMTLIDDENMSVIEPLSQNTSNMPLLYDFDLMEGGGRIKGWQVSGDLAASVSSAISSLPAQNGVLMVVGDGNHSLAAAKKFWDALKETLPESMRDNHPARYSLVELNNVYDPAVTFEAIHRVVLDTDAAELIKKLKAASSGSAENTYKIKYISDIESGEFSFSAVSFGSVIGEIQSILDSYIEQSGVIDYIHGEDSVREIVRKNGGVGILMPSMDKSDLFKTVISGEVFPRKSFSIGHSREKRYYLEARAITK